MERKKHVVFDVDVMGGISLKDYFMENSISIFIKPPSMEVLSKRLKKRNTEDRKSIKNRLEKSFEEMKSIDKFDKIIVNDELSISSKNIIETVKKFFEIEMKKKVGLYFGTFNPIHVGHLIISNYMVGYTNLDEVWFVVSPLNPLKKKRVFIRRLPSLKFGENCN